MLAQFQRENAADVTVVLVSLSSDHTELEMVNFARGKGFLRIPYKHAARQRLQQKCGINMYPTLAIVDATTGQLITSWGRAALSRNKEGCLEAWRAGQSGCTWFELVCNVQ